MKFSRALRARFIPPLLISGSTTVLGCITTDELYVVLSPNSFNILQSCVLVGIYAVKHSARDITGSEAYHKIHPRSLDNVTTLSLVTISLTNIDGSLGLKSAGGIFSTIFETADVVLGTPDVTAKFAQESQINIGVQKCGHIIH